MSYFRFFPVALRKLLRNESPLVLGKDRAELPNRVFIDGFRGLGLALCGLVLVGVIGFFDYVTGPEMSFAIFYLLPVALGAWWGGFYQGILLSVACAVSWQIVEIAEGSNVNPGIQLWNSIARAGIFIFSSSLLSRLRVSLFLEKKLARSDQLTGAANGRTFYENVSLNVEQALRTHQPLTLAYLDLDNFKWVNDNLGHASGDALLCELAYVIQHNIRMVDHLARLGGDEFAVLLSDCGEDDSRGILERIRDRFEKEMAKKKWPVTLSVGAVTFAHPGRDVDAMVRQVDELMYRAKKAGKNRIVHQVVAADDESAEKSKVIERRATARVVCDRIARIRSKDERDCLDEYARVRDISASGVCLYLENQMPEGTLLAIEPLHECGAVALLARVMWSVEENGGWLHECVLTNRLTSEELQFWIEEQTAESVHDCC